LIAQYYTLPMAMGKRKRDRQPGVWSYSVRSALIGEIAAARPAGMMAAKNAHPASDPARRTHRREFR
jgi:hypothetical protein